MNILRIAPCRKQITQKLNYIFKGKIHKYNYRLYVINRFLPFPDLVLKSAGYALGLKFFFQDVEIQVVSVFGLPVFSGDAI